MGACNPYTPGLFAATDDGRLPETCYDGLHNARETDVDCGGDCDPCPDGDLCRDPTDCVSGVCDGGQCLAPTCDDDVRNGRETDIDCGGDCDPCPTGDRCSRSTDCVSGVCVDDECQAASCLDERKNGAETDIDCGGPTGADACLRCAVGDDCELDRDCADGLRCEPATLVCVAGGCGNEALDAGETDVDCGGPDCPPCAVGQGCERDTDCLGEATCDDRRCVPPSCANGALDPGETAADCGGPDCAPCAIGRACLDDTDCVDGAECAGGTCALLSCHDAARNGEETDIDCGGSACAACIIGQACVTARDCVTQACDGGSGRCVGPLLLYQQLQTEYSIRAQLVLENGGDRAVDLSALEIRYYFTTDDGDVAAAPVFACLSGAETCATVAGAIVTLPSAQRTPLANAYCAIGFSDRTVAAGATETLVEFEIRREPSGATAFTLENDYSFDAAALTPRTNSRIVVYLDGDRISGVEPG